MSTLSIFITKCFAPVNRPMWGSEQDLDLNAERTIPVPLRCRSRDTIRCEIHPKSVETTPCDLSPYAQEFCEPPGSVANGMGER